LPDASLLTKFRTQRLQETSVDDVIQEVVRQCIEKSIIKGTGMSITNITRGQRRKNLKKNIKSVLLQGKLTALA
jgi:hypothetical protein